MESYIINMALELIHVYIIGLIVICLTYLLNKNKVVRKNISKGIGLLILIFTFATLIGSDTSYKHEVFDREEEAVRISSGNTKELDKVIIKDLSKEIKSNVNDFEKLTDYN